MADITSTRASVRAAFRDHRVEGVPASGENQPDKSEIRSALAEKMVDLIAELGASAAAGRRVFGTIAERDAWTDRPVGSQAYVEATELSYRWTGTAWDVFSDPTIEAAQRAETAASAAEDAVAEVSGALVGVSRWNPSSPVYVGNELLSAAMTSSDGHVLLAFTPSGRMITQRQSNFLAGADARYSGGGTLDDLETALIAFARRGSGHVTHIRGLARPAALPSVGAVCFFGQSNATAEQSEVVTSPGLNFGDYMLGRHIFTWNRDGADPVNRDARLTRLQPLAERYNAQPGNGEFGAFGVSAGLKMAAAGGGFLSGLTPAAAPHVVYHSPARGARYLSELVSGNQHMETWLDDVSRAKSGASDLGHEDFAVFGCIFDQGSAEASMKLSPSGPTLSWEGVRSGYVGLFNDMMDIARPGIEARTGQPSFPVFITQGPRGPAAEAHMDIADQRVDSFVTGPRYQYPSAVNSIYLNASGVLNHGSELHYTGDAHRWRGEQVGRIMRKVLCEGRGWEPLRPLEFTRLDNGSIRVRFHVPVPPLRISDVAQVLMPGRGFQVYRGSKNDLGNDRAAGTLQPITSVAVDGWDAVVVSFEPHAGPVCLAYGREDVLMKLDMTAQRAAATPCVYTVNGNPRSEVATEILIAGDHVAELQACLNFGVVAVTRGSALFYAREVYAEGGATVLKGWAKDLSGAFATGVNEVVIRRDQPGGNLHDSDDGLSHFSFEGLGLTARRGETYPLNNHCIVFWEDLA